jgi:hypothetical protein
LPFVPYETGPASRTMKDHPLAFGGIPLLGATSVFLWPKIMRKSEKSQFALSGPG